MAKFRFTRNTVLGGGKLARVGDVVDESEITGYVRQFLYHGQIVPHDETVIKSASVEVEHRDPRPERKRGRPRKGD